MTKDLIEKLEKKTNFNLKVVSINNDDDKKLLLIKFLEKQNFLEIKKIQSILKINFIDDSPIGYALLKNNSEVVGFLGTIFSKRRIQNQLFDHCYLHTWIVSKNYRMQSFRLIKPVLEKKVFISTFSPIKSLEGLYKKLYFEEKNYFTKFIIASPINFSDNKMKLIDDRSLFENKLSESNKKVCADHNSLGVDILFVCPKNDINDFILIIAKKKIKKKIFPVLEIIYVSNIQKFKENEKEINIQLIKKFKTIFFVENYFDNNSLFSKKKLFTKINEKKGYYKNVPKSHNLNFLYSEILD